MPTRVTIDGHRVTRVNGSPLFPVTARHVPTGADYAVLRAMGFNAVRWMAFGGDKMERGDAPPPTPGELGGLKFYPYVYNRGDLSRDADARTRELTALVQAVRDRDDLLGYEQRNEPAQSAAHPAEPQGSAEGMAAGSAVIRGLDPHHPIRIGHLCSNLVSTLRTYNAACDIVSCNPYVVQAPGLRRFVGTRPDGWMTDHADRTMSAVGRYTDKMVRVARGRQVWMQLQASSNENWWNPDHTPETRGHGHYEHHRLYPTYFQMRFMAFHAIIHGAMGLEWFLYRHPIDAPSFLDVRRVIGELRDLHDVLASPSVPHDFAIEYEELGFSDWEGVETLVKLHGERPYILAANPQMDPMVARFAKLPAGMTRRLEVVGEGRTIDLEGGGFTDRLGPYEVHVYAAG